MDTAGLEAGRMSPLRFRDHELSAAYLDAMDDARKLIDELLRDGWPLARIVTRARNLYRAIHRDELIRHRSREAASV